MSRLQAQQTFSEDQTASSLAPAEAFTATLLSIMGRRRVVVLYADSDSDRSELLVRLMRHLEAEGALAMRAAGSPSATVESLLESGAYDILDRRHPPEDFDAVVDAVADRLELAGTGVLIIDESHRLSVATLGDLFDLAASVSPSGRFLQVLLAGRAGLAGRIAEIGDAGGMGGAVEIRMAAAPADEPVPAIPRQLTASAPAATAATPPARPVARRRGGPERWLAALLLLVIAGGAVLVAGGPDLRSRAASLATEALQQVGLLSKPAALPVTAAAPSAPAVAPHSIPAAPPATGEQLVTPPPAAQTTPAPAPTVPAEPRPTAAAPVTPPSSSAPAAAPTPAPAPAPTAAAPAPARAAPVARAAEPPPVPRPPAPAPTAGSNGSSTSAALRAIASLTARAQRQIEGHRLTTPAGDNALETVAAIEGVAATAPQADEIRDAIVASYLQLGRQAELRDQGAIARTYYRRGLQARPGHEVLSLRLRSLLREEQDAAPPAPPPPAQDAAPALGPPLDDTPRLR